jgi:glutamate dehydrogenase
MPAGVGSHLRTVRSGLPKLLTGRDLSGFEERRDSYLDLGVPLDLADRLQITRLRDRITALPREDRWSTKARAVLRNDLEASPIRTARSFFTSASGRGSSTGKCSDPLVEVYAAVSLASWGITDPLCGR